ncbi:MAG: MoaD/ThiS family protein [Corynebacterium sp.]|nr:MoaD/ThiS family protein [Corynebacterium sp.]
MDIYYFAAAESARGRSRETVQYSGSLGQLLQMVSDFPSVGTTAAGMSLAEVFSKCTFLVDGKQADAQTDVTGAKRIDVLPPFAGG